jgi:hypothetical protein
VDGNHNDRTRIWRGLLGAPLFLVLASGPAAAEVTLGSANASTSVQAMSGVFDFSFAAVKSEIAPPGFEEFDSNQSAAPNGPFPSTSTARQQASVQVTEGGIFATATAFARARSPLVDPPPLSNLFAAGSAQFSISGNSTGPAFFSISGSATGTIGSISVNCFDSASSEPLVTIVDQRTANATGRIEGSGGCSVHVATQAERNGNRDFLAPGEETGTFQVTFVMAPLEPEDGDEFVWIGGPQGNFDVPENWDPSGPPTSDDTAVFSQGDSAAVALSQALAAAASAPADARLVPRGPTPVEILL